MLVRCLKKYIFAQSELNKHINMSNKCYKGTVSVKANELNLDLTLLGGQSFRWEKFEQANEVATQWRGVAFNAYWELEQSKEELFFKVVPAAEIFASGEVQCRDQKFFKGLLEHYLHIEFDINSHVNKWRNAHKHFAEIAPNMKAVRVLQQEPLENILSFICSQNNNIKRISSMINFLCSKYGQKIGHFNQHDVYTFPSLEALIKEQPQLERTLREAKFGYRAKFISQTVGKLAEFNGEAWFAKLRQLPYPEARLELIKLPGIGFKVADCICLMSLGHLEAVPIDTHIFKIAQMAYLPELSKVKSVTPKIYDDIANHFRAVYGAYAGWAQAVLFCSGLQQFNSKNSKKLLDEHITPVAKKKKRK